jgi:hypothetical protein
MAFVRWTGRCVYLFALAATLIASSTAYADIVTDDFSDGTDTGGDPVNNPTWSHLDGLVGSTGQAWNASTGAYRLTAPSNGVLGDDTLGFVGGHVGPSMSDVRVSMDIVDFHTTFTGGPPGPSFVNIMARSNGDNAFAALTGYAFGYDFVANAGGGELVLLRFDPGIDLNDMSAQRVHLDETKDYRFVLELIGNVIHGQVFNLTDGGVMIGEAFTNIATEGPVYASGTSGMFGYTESPFSTDFTIDNFRAETAVAGDYNRDGATDAADYVLWRKTVGQMTPQLAPETFEVIGMGLMMANGAVSGTCEFNTPNCEVIDDADYGVWSTNFGGSVADGGGSAPIPEPASGLLMLLGLSSLSFARHGKACGTK